VNLKISLYSIAALTFGSNNCTSTWQVPANVTTIFVECWGGGGGGGYITGGGGGGYISVRMNVTASATANLQIGAGGSFSVLFSSNGITGGSSIFSIAGMSITANGGFGGIYSVPGVVSISAGLSPGGDFSVSGIADNYYGAYGSPGGITQVTFMQINATDFGTAQVFGNGGDAGNLPGSGARGGYRFASPSVTQTISGSNFAILPGGGGSADHSEGWRGRGGRIIIHW